MIKINDKIFEQYKFKIIWGTFDATIFGEKRKGISPIIVFNIDDNIFIRIETIVEKEMLENIKVNEKVNIKPYLTDITYEDEEGWVSIISGKYNCDITRISDKNFKIEFCIESEEIERIDIIMDAYIDLF